MRNAVEPHFHDDGASIVAAIPCTFPASLRVLGLKVNVPTFFSSPHPDTKLQHSLCQFFFNHRIKSRKNKPFAIRSWKRESQRNDPQLLTNFEACQFGETPRSNPDLAEGFIIKPAQQQLVGLPSIKDRHSLSTNAADHACSGCKFHCRCGLAKAKPFPESLDDRVKRVFKKRYAPLSFRIQRRHEIQN